MAQYVRKLHIDQPYLSGSPVIKVPLGGKIMEARVILDGQITLAGGAAVNAIGEGAPVELVKRIKLHGTRADARYWEDGYLVDCSARSLVRYAITERGKQINDLGGVNLGNGANGVYQIHTSIPIYFADPNMKRQKGTALNSNAYASLQLQLDLAQDLSTSLYGYAGAVDFSQLHVQYSDERVFVDGDTDILVQEDHDMFIGAAQGRALDAAMPTDGTLLQMLIQAESGVGAGGLQIQNDAILNKARFTADNVDFEKYAKDIRQQMFDDQWFDASQSATGKYFVDFMDGKSANGLDLSTFAHYYDVNNPSGTFLDRLRIYTRRGYRPSGFAPASF